MGVINKAGAFIVPPKFDFVSPFKNGLAQFNIMDITGYLNQKGSVIRDTIK